MCYNYMPASYWGLLAKVGPYKLTKTDEKHLHERGNNKHYISAFTRMRPSSLGSETLPKGIQSQEAWIPKINFRMVENPKFQSGAVGRGLVFRPQQNTDRDRAVFNSMESQMYADRNVSNLDTEQRPQAFDGAQTRPSVSTNNLPYFPVNESDIDSTASALRDYLASHRDSTSSGVLTPMSMESGDWHYNPTYDRKRSITSPAYNIGQNKRYKKGLTARIPKRSNQTSRYTRDAEYQPKLQRGIKRKATHIGKKAKKQKKGHTYVKQFTPKAVIDDTPKNRKLETMLNRGTNPERSQASKILAKKLNLSFK